MTEKCSCTDFVHSYKHMIPFFDLLDARNDKMNPSLPEGSERLLFIIIGVSLCCALKPLYL